MPDCPFFTQGQRRTTCKLVRAIREYTGNHTEPAECYGQDSDFCPVKLLKELLPVLRSKAGTAPQRRKLQKRVVGFNQPKNKSL